MSVETDKSSRQVSERGVATSGGWSSTEIMAMVFSVVSVVLTFLQWFDIRYVSLFTEHTGYSMYGFVIRCNELGELVDLGYYTALVYIMGIGLIACVGMHIFTAYQVIQRKPRLAVSVGASGFVSAIECVLIFVVVSVLNDGHSIVGFQFPFYLFALVSLLGMIYYGAEAGKQDQSPET